MATLAEIREYNKQVQQYQKKAAELKASIDYKQKELATLCNEISTMSGQTVTPENLEAYAAEVEKRFEQTLSTGREVLARAKAEEERVRVAPIEDTEAEATSPAPTVKAEGTKASANPIPTPAPTPTPMPTTPANNSPFGGGFAGFAGMEAFKFPGLSGDYDSTGNVGSL